jgi:hypothetical protein
LTPPTGARDLLSRSSVGVIRIIGYGKHEATCRLAQSPYAWHGADGVEVRLGDINGPRGGIDKTGVLGSRIGDTIDWKVPGRTRA